MDNIITHGNSGSPVVLGLKVTNKSLGAITDVLQKLPNEQLDQIRSVVCEPMKDLQDRLLKIEEKLDMENLDRQIRELEAKTMQEGF